jgi:A/G-specific adenine glycosylase
MQDIPMANAAFRKKIRDFYKKEKRIFPWRETTDPYFILVSEIMLQQTQADRVVGKYNSFLKKWPTVKKLANAELRDVLAAWSGLGYNRRGKNLWLLAKKVIADYKGKIPDTTEALEDLPGIGPYTARAISAFAFNKPYPLIETNIRSVYIDAFFKLGKKMNGDDISPKIKIADAELFPYIEATLDKKNPREWYYALMDYGAYLKKTGKAKNDRHKSYTKQSTFKGSVREARGAILRELIKAPSTLRNLQEKIKAQRAHFTDARIAEAVTSLVKDGSIIAAKGLNQKEVKNQKSKKYDSKYTIAT